MRLWLLLLSVIGIAAALYFTQPQAPLSHGYGVARIGGAFTLTGTNGKSVNESDFRGRLMLIYMGYSHCPDICPMTLSAMSEALKSLGPDADKVAAIFISLDPERDTPQALASYLSAFNPAIIGLTGSKAAIETAAKAYKVYYKKVPTPNTGSYLVDHSGFLYLMDKQGKYIMHFDATTKASELAQALRDHL